MPYGRWVLHLQLEPKKPGTYLHAAALVTLPLIYVLLMYYYYGDWRPNTAHLKSFDLSTALGMSVAYFKDYTQSGFVPLIAAIILLIPKKSRFSILVLTAALAHLLYVALIGGDFFEDGRFLMLLLPTVSATLLHEIERRAHRGTHFAQAALGTFAIMLVLWQAPTLIKASLPALAVQDETILEQVRVAHVINEVLEPADGSIGLHYLGLGYHTPAFHVVDFLGKAEPHIARTQVKFGPPGHNRWDYDYALSNYDIAIIPIGESVVRMVSEPGFEIVQRDWMFWGIAAKTALDSGRYTYVTAAEFGNQDLGALVRNDLLGKFEARALNGGRQ